MIFQNNLSNTEHDTVMATIVEGESANQNIIEYNCSEANKKTDEAVGSSLFSQHILVSSVCVAYNKLFLYDLESIQKAITIEHLRRSFVTVII